MQRASGPGEAVSGVRPTCGRAVRPADDSETPSHDFARLGLEHDLLRRVYAHSRRPAVSSTDPANIAVLFEDTQRSVKVIAEGHGVLAQHIADLEAKDEQHDGELDQLEIRVAVLDTKHEELSAETRRRLDRIEAHLGLGEPTRPRHGP